VDPQRARIFRLIETADNFVKYAPPNGQARAAKRARARYQRALELAQNRGDEELIGQVGLRMADLERRASAPNAPQPIGEFSERGTHNAGEGERTGTWEPNKQNAREGERAGPRQLLDDTAEHGTKRVPPGQRVTRGWPVLHEGPIPHFDRDSWRLTFDGACERAFGLAYDELRALPKIDLRSDFHCVTGWSKLDNLWTGVQTKVLLERSEPLGEASHVLVHAEHGYTANLPHEVLMQDDSIVTWSHNQRDLEPKHGFPLRLLVPGLYGWKSVKWVRRIQLLTDDQRGFWEVRGYHNLADPWLEQRYSYQEG
jgi:DMSO/TMAO reductase YedYZ molybdopterin-dependent catalytic subunit